MRLLSGAVYVTVTRRFEGNAKFAEDSGEVNARMSMQLQRSWTSMKKLNLFFRLACHVRRPFTLRHCESREPWKFGSAA